jgi:hypothetical protein
MEFDPDIQGLFGVLFCGGVGGKEWKVYRNLEFRSESTPARESCQLPTSADFSKELTFPTLLDFPQKNSSYDEYSGISQKLWR